MRKSGQSGLLKTVFIKFTLIYFVLLGFNVFGDFKISSLAGRFGVPGGL